MSTTRSALTPQRWPFGLAAEAAGASTSPDGTALQAGQGGQPGGPAVTDWFSPNTQPVQVGVYQRRNSLGKVCYSLWDGGQWFWNQPSPALAERETEPSMAQYLPWRGLSEPPAEGYGPAVGLDGGTPC